MTEIVCAARPWRSVRFGDWVGQGKDSPRSSPRFARSSHGEVAYLVVAAFTGPWRRWPGVAARSTACLLRANLRELRGESLPAAKTAPALAMSPLKFPAGSRGTNRSRRAFSSPNEMPACARREPADDVRWEPGDASAWERQSVTQLVRGRVHLAFASIGAVAAHGEVTGGRARSEALAFIGGSPVLFVADRQGKGNRG